MVLINESRRTVIAHNVYRAETFLKRLRGLLGRDRRAFPAGAALLILPCKQVHTFFMRFPIDVLFIDDQYRVLKTIEFLHPYRVSPFVKQARAVIELPPGTIAATGTLLNDRLNLVNREVWT
ncbi:DUF192 domain-containing protein [Desulfallas sp. Bu1-1]|uniref:DUF192 domain-containing protein n=1 Tax=Desulfallas sp. Bu1-1 TaxID=2787620 RepID=UPI0018A0240D|nr:DUF192 domain-containing protein [Desulfallas sp. Bu1-1]MBF7082494.1 DUF192 domain-containing protein [Desulfallas sp. Bu1-1]